VNGICVVDKPAGISSYDVVRRLKQVLPKVKIGYLGTLDPLATGVLPILLGEGTKLAPFLEDGKKEYEALICLGVTTDTQDREGHVLRAVDPQEYELTPGKIEEVIGRFRGRIMQLPPMYSAHKRNGEPLYKLARKGEEVERALQEVEISLLELTRIDLPMLELRVECSKGTYIRTLAHDIGQDLECGAFLAALRRTRSGIFSLAGALMLDTIEKGRIADALIPLSQAVSFLPAVEVDEAQAAHITNGHGITLTDCDRPGETDHRVRVVARHGGRLIAVGEIARDGLGLVIKPLRVFHDVLFTKKTPYGTNKSYAS
jgi:tRNA pseudouridine55 synthase